MRELHQLATAKASAINAWFAERLTVVEFLARAELVQSLPPEERARLAHAYVELQSDLSAIVGVGADGTVRWDSAVGAVQHSVSVADRDYYITARSGEIAISDVITARNSGARVVIVAVPVPGRNASDAVLFGSVMLNTVEEIVRGERESRSRIDSYLLDASGALITAPSGFQIASQAEPTLITREQQPHAGVTRYTNVAGVEVFGVARAVLNGKWTMITEIRVYDAVEQLRQYNTLLMWVLAAVTVVSVGTAWGIARSIERPLSALLTLSELVEQRAYRLAAGAELPPHAPLELDQLGHALKHTAGLVANHVEELEAASITDPLTGLPNRRHFEAEASRIVAMCTLQRRPCAVLVMDIDRFKRINDTFGHDVGDAALRWFAETVAAIKRDSDYIARIGGEEFVLFAPNADAAEAHVLAERVRAGVAEQPFVSAEKPIPLTVSIGLATVEPGVPSSEMVLDHDRVGHDAAARSAHAVRQADAAMYLSKERGRNRVTVYEPTIPLRARNAQGGVA